MKAKLLLAIIALMAFAVSASAQQDPLDAGDPDSLIIVFAETPDVGNQDSVLVVEIYIVSDNPIKSISCGWSWTPAKISLETAYFSDAATIAFDMMRLFYYKNMVDSSNAVQQCQMTGLRMMSPSSYPGAAGRRLLATYEFVVDSLTPTDEILFDYLGSYVPMAFIADNNDEYTPLFGGSVHFFDPSNAGSNTGGNLPTKFDLNQNYPNPFNPATMINFDLPKAAHATLSVFNVLGQKVVTLMDEHQPAGSYQVEWKGTSDGGNKVASGIYFYRLEAGKDVMTKKMMLLK